MRRSLDFGTLTGSLSTLKSSRSNGDSNSNGCTINGTTHSASPSGSRFGTVAGIPTSDAGSLSNDHFKRPRSALSSGWERAARNGGGRRGFALGSLFGGSGSGQQETIHDDSTSKAAHLHASESITDVQHHSSLDPANTPPTPDTPAEREHALMLAVQAAKAKDQAWQIVVQPAPSEGLFLEYANGRNNKLGKTPRHEVGTNRGASFPSSSSNAMLAGLSGRARRLLGRTGDKSMAIASNLSPTSEEVVASSATIAADSSQGATSKHLNGASETRGPQTSAAKRPLEASEDNMNSLPVSMSSAPAVPTCDDLQPATNTPVSDVMTALLPASTHVNQLLVLYVTTGSSSLTLYRTVGQLVKLDEEVRPSSV